MKTYLLRLAGFHCGTGENKSPAASLVVAASFHALTSLAPSVRATLITSAGDVPSSTVITFNQFIGTGANQTFGPVQIGGLVGLDVVFTADPESGGNSGNGSVLGECLYNLGANGEWGNDFVPENNGFSALDARFGGMTYTFNTAPVRAVGGFINYTPALNNPAVLLEALATDGTTVLETYNFGPFGISTPGAHNDGAFLGILRESADIGAFRVSNSFVALDNLTFSTPAPEPTSTILLVGTGAMLLLRRRRAGTV